MTEYSLLQTAMGLIIVALVAVASIIFITTKVMNTQTELKTMADDMAIINAAHLVKKCLETDGVITETLLTSSSGKSICDICRNMFRSICNMQIGAMVKDIESADEWKFGYTGNGEHKENIFINIVRDTGEINVGRLYAEA